MQCRKCSAWEINGRDLFCSWCGRKVFEFGLRPTPVRLYHAKGKAPRPRSAHIVVNQSPIPVTIECVEPPPWLQVNPVKTEVAPGGQLRVTLGVDPQKFGGGAFKRETIVFRPAAAKADGRGDFESLRVTVETWPEPQVTCGELVAYTGKQPPRARLRVHTDTPLTVVGLRFTPPYLAPDGELPLELNRVGEAEIPVVLNLPPQAEFKKELVTCHFEVDGLAQPLAAQFELVVKKSAVLYCPELEAANFSARLMPDAEEEMTLTVHNRGEEVLSVAGVKIEPHKPSPGVEVRPEPPAFEVEPGKQASVRLKVSASPAAQPDRTFFQITFQSNDPVAEHGSGNLSVEVFNEVYPEFIALDFGTTDSAVAVFKVGGRSPENLYLEKGIKDPKIYSNIVFLKYKGDEAEPPYHWEIGREAKSFGSTPQFSHLFFKAVKTKVGKNHEMTLLFTNLGVERKVKAEAVIKFILRDLLQRTQQALGYRPARFILSVPTRFTLRQKKILKDTFSEAALSLRLNLEKVRTIDESLAAGLFYIVNRGQRDELLRKKGSYTMMLLDFGGGTTDVTVFRVRRPPDASATNPRGLKIETIGAWGDAELGGERITTLIAELLAEKFLGRKIDGKEDADTVRRLEDKAEAAKLTFSCLLGLSSADGQPDLRAASEESRKKLGESLAALDLGTEKYDDERLGNFLQQYPAGGRVLQVWSGMFRNSVQLSESEVTGIYERKLLKIKEDLRRLLEMIGQRLGEGDGAPPRLDILLLAGQSSQFPTVTRLLSDLAENTDFVRDAEGSQVLKECVSRGALYYSRKGALGLEITGENRMWSRVGLDAGVGEFTELIPWGQEYPFETPPFSLYEDNVFGDRLELKLDENLSLDDGSARIPVPFKSFVLKLEDEPQEEYRCKLEVTIDGDVKAFCEVDGKWLPMNER